MNQETTFQNGTVTTRKIQFFELMVFMLLFVPSIVLSYFTVEESEEGFIYAATATIVHNCSLVGLILFFLWRNREAVSLIGWTKSGWLKEAGLGVVLFLPFTVVSTLFEELVLDLGLHSPSESLPSFLAAQGPYQFVLATVLVVIVAISEETIYRGYLILRLRPLVRSNWISAVISSGIFSLGHGYEGSAGVATVAVMGFMFAGIFIWRKSLTAPIVMHFLQDLIGIVLAPLLENL
jgi:membrane protease YdiL (CAAX protease family)